jgi:hypothetical protein
MTSSCNLDLQVMWQGQSTLVQALTFSILLVTMAITMQHLSLSQLSRNWRRGRLFLAACLALVAVAVGGLAVAAYALRSVKYHAGCEGEAGVHRAYLGLAVFLVCLEAFFAVYTFVFAAVHEWGPA